MNTQITSSIQAVINGLAPLAEKLGVPASQIYHVMLKQNYIYGVYDFMWVVLIFVVSVFTIKWILKWWTKPQKTENNSYPDYYFEDDGGRIIASIILGIALVIVIIQGIYILQEGIGRIINPPYYIAHDIINLIPAPSSN